MQVFVLLFSENASAGKKTPFIANALLPTGGRNACLDALQSKKSR